MNGFAQTDSSRLRSHPDYAKVDSTKQKDIGDLLEQLFKRNKDSTAKKQKKLDLSVIPSAGYTLTTGFAADLTGNGAFYTSAAHRENLSVITGDVSYDVKLQKIFVSRSEIWLNNNKIKLTSDIRWEQFPEDTYGFGTASSADKANPILFDYVNLS